MRRRARCRLAARLHGAHIDRHARGNPIVADVDKLNAESIDRGVEMDVLHVVYVRTRYPNTHVEPFSAFRFAAACKACGSKPAKRL